MKLTMFERLIDFLRWELAIPEDSIAIAHKMGEQDPNRLPMILWQYGLLSLEQLDLVFDWMETI